MAKRKYGEGSIFLRKDGRWEGRVVVGYKENGNPKTKNVTAKTQAECKEKLQALKVQQPLFSYKSQVSKTNHYALLLVTYLN